MVLAWNTSVFDLKVFQDLDNNSNFKVTRKVFSRPNPTVEDLLEFVLETKDDKPQVIIGVGGGSVMDLGKSLCMTYEHNIVNTDDIRRMIEHKEYKKPKTKWIGIPTTSGTGSEVTCWATIWDPEMDKKRSVHSTMNYAYAAIVDPILLHTQPLGSAMGSAIDAAAQAVEAYWSNHTNIISRSYALTVIPLIMNNLEDLAAGKMEVYDEISQGSLLSGLSFSNTQTTACHAISYPLTMRFNIPHGVAVGLLLAPVMYFNEKTILNKASLFAALKVKSTKELDVKIRTLFEAAGVASTLSGWGVTEDDLQDLALLANTPGIFDNNPVDLSEEDIMKILKKAL